MGVGCGVEGRVSNHEGVSYSLYIYCAFDLFAGKIRPVHTFYEMLQIREQNESRQPCAGEDSLAAAWGRCIPISKAILGESP